MSFLSKIKSFFVTKEEEQLGEFFAKYLKIRAELLASDVKVSERELNFKVAWQGSVVPFWMSSKYEIADVTSIIAMGLALGLNLVEISQALKNYGVDK